MGSYLFHLRRKPLPLLAVLLFAAILSAVLCMLHSGEQAAQRHYKEIFQKIEVTCTVTNLTGDFSDHLAIPESFLFLLRGEFPYNTEVLPQMLTDLEWKGSHRLSGSLSEYTLIGITSTQMAQELWPENGCVIHWNSGYDINALLRGGACIIPEELLDRFIEEGTSSSVPSELSIQLSPKYRFGSSYNCVLPVVGIYQGGHGDKIYCAWDTLADIWVEMNEFPDVDAIQGKLKSNDLLEEFSAEARKWFAEPNAGGIPTPWGREGYDYFPYAMDIDDSQLQQTQLTLENSLRVNHLCTALVFLLSVGAGFFIGFLMIRQRKREITLMRTLGTGHFSIYVGFTLEQMLCVIAGTALGGAVFGWQPVVRLVIFVSVYFVSLTVALVIFLRRNLLTTIKEDE